MVCRRRCCKISLSWKHWPLRPESRAQEDTMRHGFGLARVGCLLYLLLISLSLSGMARAGATDEKFVSRVAEVEGVKLHYTTGGHGTPLILLHGYAETSRMWTPILPVRGEKFTGIAPDLPGIGEPSIPDDGLAMKTAAIRVHSLARSLGVEKARWVGHDIVLVVAYAYAPPLPSYAAKLVVM